MNEKKMNIGEGGFEKLTSEQINHIREMTEATDVNQYVAEHGCADLLYYVSDMRSNILESLSFLEDATILEINSSCGVLTNALARIATSVICVDTSECESRINVARNQNFSNIEIHVGAVRQSINKLDKKVDVVVLADIDGIKESTGVTLAELLEMSRDILKRDGMIFVAGSNRYGLKFWAGNKSQSSNGYFSTIERTTGAEGPLFSLKEAEKLLSQYGYSIEKEYYPYPDHIYTTHMYSTKNLPHKGELVENMCNYGLNRMYLFEEGTVFDNIIAEGEFPFFTNSFLLICTRGA